jgi:lysozyme family protein
VSALQRFLKNNGWGYTGPIDGEAGSGTQAAFATFANWCVANY